MSQKACHYYFDDNFSKRGPIFRDVYTLLIKRGNDCECQGFIDHNTLFSLVIWQMKLRRFLSSNHNCNCNSIIINYNLSKHPVSQKTGHPTLVHNFAKCWPIFKILSSSGSAVSALEALCDLHLHYISHFAVDGGLYLFSGSALCNCNCNLIEIFSV